MDDDAGPSYLSFSADLDDPATVAAYDEMPLWSAMFGLLLLRQVPLIASGAVLDVGCGTGFPLLELAQRCGPACRAYGIDTWRPALLRADEASEGATTNVFTIDPATGATTQLTHTRTFDGNPAWSPDGRRIVFTSNRANSKDNHIYVMDADGSNATPLTSAPGTSDWGPKFAPDGKRIVYASGNTSDGSYRIVLMDADGSNPRALAGPYPFAEFPAWTRDGAQVYFAAIAKDKNDLDIYDVDPRTGDVVTRIATPGNDLCPHFSRDGRYLTYATAASGEEGNVDLFRHELSSPDTTGASDERLTSTGGFDDYANASPDDKQYVFVSQRDGDFELYLMDRDGSNQRRLTNTPGIRENVPDW